MSGGVEAAGERSVAAGGNIGRVTTGDHVTQIEHAVLLPPEALATASCPGGLANVPRRHAHFVGRKREISFLDEEFDIVVICGLGGVGKSTLAARWAAGKTGERTLVWWITAENRSELDAGLVGLAVAMQPALIDVLPPEALRERALQWLSTHDEWLLVLDNVSDPADIEPLVARVRRGQILITTRQTGGWYGIARVLTLDVPDGAESVEMFTRILTHAGPRAASGARHLCAVLGQLPLAVAQAAAYCAETSTEPFDYLEQLRQYPGELYEIPVEGGVDGGQAVAWTWRLTLDRLAAADPLTGTILRTLAWWGPDRIPRALLDRIASPFAVRRALGRLASHSMLTLHEDGAVSVHRLVQAVARTPHGSDPHRRAEDIAAARLLAEEALASAAPTRAGGVAEWGAWRELFPHVETYVHHTDPSADTAHTAALLDRAARFLLEHSDTERAAAWFERAVECRQRVLGEDHPETAGSREGVAECWAIQGELGPSAELQERAVADLERVLGEGRAETHMARCRLAVTWRHLGDKEAAVTLLEGALAGLERILGPRHRDTLWVRSNLGVAYQDAGRLERAIALQERTLGERRGLLGPDHPETLTSRLNLVRLYEAVGQLERATTEFDAVVSDGVRALGEEHPFAVHLMHVRPPRAW
ncbi:FxSxx-COOH system tetratricopeptide repeat protein [Streptomyces sp. NPDC002992]|uniref:FxSxx-COOH system tetratricopeptide repeat protein n=1 Tax=Streptomyces sp. NPDC002992 TaxID=3154273 RepID=UPI0033BF888E